MIVFVLLKNNFSLWILNVSWFYCVFKENVFDKMSTCAWFRLYLIMNLFFKSIHKLFKYNIFYMFIYVSFILCGNIIELTWNKCFPSRTDDVTSGEILTAQTCLLIHVVTKHVMDVQCRQTAQHSFTFILYVKNLLTRLFWRSIRFYSKIILKKDSFTIQKPERNENKFR